MRVLFLTCAVMFTLSASAVHAQETPPPECHYDVAGQLNYEACAAASEPGSPWRSLSLMNLGTQAFLRGDYAAAVRFYDEADPTGGETNYSDASFHAYKAASLHQVGRADEAIIEARRSIAVLRADPNLPEEVRRRFSSAPVDRELVYAAVLPVLHSANDALAPEILSAYRAISPTDWVSWANRAGVFEQLGDLDGAIGASAEALRLQPTHPAVLNNHCYILVRANRAAEALPFCEQALAAAPTIAGVHHSVASAYAQLGRCEDARRAMSEARRLDSLSVEYQTELACAPA